MHIILKKILLAFCACALCGGIAGAASMPAFDKPNSLVYDTENGKEDKFVYLITAADYAHDGKVVAEVWGYGGKEAEEWKSLGEMTFVGFNEIQRLNSDANKYVRYRYIAIQLKSGKRNFTIKADQKKRNMNFYFWEEGDDPSVNPLPFNSDHPTAYTFDVNVVDEKIGGNVRIVNEVDCADGLECTLYAYNEKKHSWLVFGECHSERGNRNWIERKKLRSNLKDHRYYSLDVFSSDGVKTTPDFNFYLTKELGGLYITVKDRQQASSAEDEVEDLRRQLEELKKQLESQ